MSRALKHLAVPSATNALANAFTVPASHKYEVVGLSIGEAIARAGDAYVLWTGTAGSGLTFWLDQFPVAAGQYVVRRNYTAMTFLEGESMLTGVAAAAGSTWAVFIDYVDVDMT